MSELPPYSVDPISHVSGPSPQVLHNRIAGDVRTCSIGDLQRDYYRIVRQSPNSYNLSLTVSPTPVYRIEFSNDPASIGDVLVFEASRPSPSLAVAAVRFTKNPQKTDPIASICTSSPHLPNSNWRTLHKTSTFSSVDDYRSSIPVVTIPGLLPTMRSFAWRTTSTSPYFELWWDGPLPYQKTTRSAHPLERDFRHLFATCVPRATGLNHDNLIEIRRGGGLDFELTVVLEVFAILHHMNKRLL
jgi:hypothetical protein